MFENIRLWLAPALILAALGLVVLWAALQARKASWQCEQCKQISNPPLLPLVFAPHTKGRKYMICPKCRRKALLRPVPKEKWK